MQIKFGGWSGIRGGGGGVGIWVRFLCVEISEVMNFRGFGSKRGIKEGG